MAKTPRYAVEVRRLYNCFDAWTATQTVLYREDGKHWRRIRSWEYDAIFSRTLSESRAEHKARQLMQDYDAVRL